MRGNQMSSDELPDRNFDSFTKEDWTAHAWDLLVYPPGNLTLDDVRDERTDIGMEDLRNGRPIHTDDSRFDDVRDNPDENNPLEDPKALLFEIYSLKEFIEESPHPENTNVRKLGNRLQRLYVEHDIEPVGVNSGDLIDRVVSR